MRNMTVIGRREDCDLRIPVGDVSRKHCRLVRTDDGIRIEDLGSSNGTYVNGQRVQESELSAGDQVGVGPVQFIVQINGVPDDDQITQPAAQLDPEDSSVRMPTPPALSAAPTEAEEYPLEEIPLEEAPLEEVPGESAPAGEFSPEQAPLDAGPTEEFTTEEFTIEEPASEETPLESEDAPLELDEVPLEAAEHPLEEVSLDELEESPAPPVSRRPASPHMSSPPPPPLPLMTTPEPEVMIEDEPSAAPVEEELHLEELHLGELPSGNGDSEIEHIELEGTIAEHDHEITAGNGGAAAPAPNPTEGDWDFVVDEPEAVHGEDDFHIDLDSPHHGQPHT